MASPSPPDFGRLLAGIARELNARHLPFMVIGGQAVLLHGEPRLTQDVDIALGVAPDALPSILDVCAAIPLRPLAEDADGFVRRTFVLPAADEETGIRVDFIFSTTPYERQAIERALEVTVAGSPVSYATAEDLILHKLFAGRPRDVEDVVAITRRKSGELDWDYLRSWAAEFSAVPGREDLSERIGRLHAESTDRS